MVAGLSGYMGDPRLKKSNEKQEWTPELLEEYINCSQDPIYFTEKYVKIISVRSGGEIVSFSLDPYQKNMIMSFKDNNNTIVTAARQAGKSSAVCAFVLWYVLFKSEQTVALLANKGDIAREMLGRIQFSYEHLPKWLQQGILEWNKGSLELENNSRIVASATSVSALRGYAINLLFIDEAAHIENWESFFTSTVGTIASNIQTKIILVSTPYGLNHFHDIWENALRGKNSYKPILVTWKDVPGRDEKWKQKTLSDMNFDVEKFNQEQECEFLGSSGTLIAGWKLKELSQAYTTPIAKRSGLSQWELPEKGHLYAMVCDVSHGKGLDYSAFQLLDVSKMPYRQVAVFRDNTVTPADYAGVIERVAKAYNDSIVLVETNDIGAQVAYSVYSDFGYENMLYTEGAGSKGKKVTAGFGTGASVERGVKTSKQVKSVACSLLKLLIEGNQLIINDHETVKELATFSRKNNTYEAESGYKDDLVVGLFLFAWLSDQDYFREYTDINTIMKLREKTDVELEEDMLFFGIVDDGQEDYESGGWKKVDSNWTPLPDYNF
jgi:hypothetical protein